MKKLLLFVVLLSALVTGSMAQSGRSRNPAPPPPPVTPQGKTQQPPPPTVLNLPEGAKVVKYDTEGATSRFVLKNGLTIITRERHSIPIAVAGIYLKSGILNETDENYGLSCLLQKLLIDGASIRRGAALSGAIARLGASLTGYSTFDRTVISATAPAESLKSLLELQADILINPTFEPEAISRAAQAVLLEKRGYNDDPFSFASARLQASAFSVSRLGRMPFGDDKVIRSATSDQLRTFYEANYRPEYTIIFVEGDFATNTVIGQVQTVFANFGKPAAPVVPSNTTPAAGPENGKTAASPTTPGNPATAKPGLAKPATQAGTALPANTKPAVAVANPVPLTPVVALPRLGPDEPQQDKLRYANDRADLGLSLISFGNHTPRAATGAAALKEQAALEVLAAALGQGNGSRLNQVLREKNAIVSSVKADYDPLSPAGLFTVHLAVPADRIDRAEGEYFREIERFRRELLSEGELQRARITVEKNQMDRTLTIQDEAELLAGYQANYGDFRYLDSHFGRIKAITPKEIQEVAARYFVLGNTSVHEYEPRTAAPRTFVAEKFAEAIAILAPGTVQQIKPEDVKAAVSLKKFTPGNERDSGIDTEKVIFVPLPLPVKDFSIYRGPRAFVREDRTQARITTGLFFQGGRLLEDGNSSGTTELMLRSMLKSTMTRKGDLIALELESYGAQVTVVNEPDYFGYILDVPSRNAEKAIAVLVEILENPYFDPKEIAKEKDLLLSRQLEYRDEMAGRARDLAGASVFQGHPYGMPRYGLAASVKTLTDDILEAWYKRTIKKQFPMIVIIGDTDGSSLVSTAFAEAFKRSSGELEATMKLNLPAPIAQTREFVEQRTRASSSQVLAFRAGTTQPNPYAVAVLANLIAGPGAKIPGDLGEKQPLPLLMSDEYRPRLAGSTFFISLLSFPEDEVRAREALLKQLEALVAGPPSDQELEMAKNRAIGTYAVITQRNSNRVREYAEAVLFNRKAVEVDNQAELIRAVKKEDVVTAAQLILKNSNKGFGAVRGEVPKN